MRLQTTLEVPVKPNGNTTLFLWPGLEPLQGDNLEPIGTGVLQPVLTWGGSCAPGSPQSSTGKNWWISAQYVNTLGSDPKHKGCYGGDVMKVEVGDQLLIDMSLSGTLWKQSVTEKANQKSVDFDFDLANQPQRWALFEIEAPTSTKPAADVVFTDTVAARGRRGVRRPLLRRHARGLFALATRGGRAASFRSRRGSARARARE
jgi:hypothetical protein